MVVAQLYYPDMLHCYRAEVGVYNALDRCNLVVVGGHMVLFDMVTAHLVDDTYLDYNLEALRRPQPGGQDERLKAA